MRKELERPGPWSKFTQELNKLNWNHIFKDIYPYIHTYIYIIKSTTTDQIENI